MDRSSPWTRIATFLALTALFQGVSATIILRHGMTWPRAVTGMWGPGVAALLTAALCRRPWAEFGWRPGRARYLAMAYVAPMLYAGAGSAVASATGLVGYNPRLAREIAGALGLRAAPDAVPLAIGLVVTGTLITAVGCFAALGEEIGWRGLLVPELARRTGFARAAVVSGLVWAVWHYPLVIPGVMRVDMPPPWYAVGCFTLLITAMGVAMAWLRLRSGSLWPAVVFHAAHNAVIQQYLTPMTSRTGPANYLVDETGAAMLPFAFLVAASFWRRRGELEALAVRSTPASPTDQEQEPVEPAMARP
jgi:membrane protease YdiL (CAAX protease family)